MAGQPEELPCPFCDKGTISCLLFPGRVTVKSKKTASLPGGKSFVKTSDIWLIQSGCFVCGKSQNQVEKELRRQNII